MHLLAIEEREIQYVVLLAVLLVLPRVLQRFRIPAAITSFAFGAIAGPALGLLMDDPVVSLLSTLGIVSIFLLAGLEVDLHALRLDRRAITHHLILRLVLIALFTGAASWVFGVDARAGVVISLAVLTPSGGFILDSLHALGMHPDEETAIRNRVIATEILALGLILFALQSTSFEKLGVSLGVLAVMIGLLPLVLRIVAKRVVPYAPKSEFAFLVLLAVLCALVTRELGVYYLVGAFVVGITARRFREQLPAMSSDRILHAVEAFTSVFAPFYFFHAGTTLRPEDFSPAAIGVGVLLLIVVGAVRVFSTLELSRWTSREGALPALRMALPMLPTLVFTLVLADILHETFSVPEYLVGGLVVYAVLNTILPGLIVRRLPVPVYGIATLPPLPSEVEPPRHD